MLSVPIAVFQCCPESIFFEERKITFTNGQVKIGRAIAQLKARPDNLIFDCKVLSRNHALLWYDSGKFLLQDTKSSNGTFVNNAQIPSEESSPPTQVYSRDYIQFGISVVDNDTKVTHGCIVAQAFLYHADGREVLKEANSEAVSAKGNRGSSQALACSSAEARLQGQLARYLKEALAREQMLDKKIKELQQLVTAAQQSSESAWQASVDEERLLTRLEMLEEQLKIFQGHFSEDDFRNELCRLKAEQMHANLEGKDSLCQALEEKSRAVVRMSELENRLTTTEEECERLRQSCQQAEEELMEVIEKLNTKLDEVQELKNRLEQEEGSRDETVKRLEAEKTNLLQKLEQATQNETALTARLSSLLEQQQQLQQQQASLETNGLVKCDDGIVPHSPLLVNGRSSSDEDSLAHASSNGVKNSGENGTDHSNGDSTDDRLTTSEKITELESRLEEGHKSVANLQAELESSQAEAAVHLARIASLEATLQTSEIGIDLLVENAASSLHLQLAESEHHVVTSRQIKQQLQDRIGQLEMELSAHFSSSHLIDANSTPAPGSALTESSGDSDISSDVANAVAESIISVEESLELRVENENFKKTIESLRQENARLLHDVEVLKSAAKHSGSISDETNNNNGPVRHNAITSSDTITPHSRPTLGRTAHNSTFDSTNESPRQENSFNSSFNESSLHPNDDHYWNQSSPDRKNNVAEDGPGAVAAKKPRRAEAVSSLLNLPPEIILIILKLLPPKDVLSGCAAVCKRLNSFIYSDDFWTSYLGHQLFDAEKFDSLLTSNIKTPLVKLRQTLASPCCFNRGVAILSDKNNLIYPINVKAEEFPETLDEVVSRVRKRHLRPFEDKPFCIFHLRANNDGATSKMTNWFLVNFRKLGCLPEILDIFKPEVTASGTSGTTRNYSSSMPQAAALLDSKGNILDSFNLMDFHRERSLLFKSCPVGTCYLIIYSRHNPVVKLSFKKAQ